MKDGWILAMLVATPVAAAVMIFAANLDANGNPAKRCDPPKRWIETDRLADDAGRRSKVVCKFPRPTPTQGNRG